MDSNHDKQIQRLLCYRYTTRQFEARNHMNRRLFLIFAKNLAPRNRSPSRAERMWIMNKLPPFGNLNHATRLRRTDHHPGHRRKIHPEMDDAS